MTSPPHADLRLDEGDLLIVGGIRLEPMHTPEHTSDSMCMRAGHKVLTGDTVLIGGIKRTDLPTGDPEALHDSLFNKLLTLTWTRRSFPRTTIKAASRARSVRSLPTTPASRNATEGRSWR